MILTEKTYWVTGGAKHYGVSYAGEVLSSGQPDLRLYAVRKDWLNRLAELDIELEDKTLGIGKEYLEIKDKEVLKKWVRNNGLEKDIDLRLGIEAMKEAITDFIADVGKTM